MCIHQLLHQLYIYIYIYVYISVAKPGIQWERTAYEALSFTAPGKFLSDPKYASISLFCGVVTLFAFTLEAYANSTPAPTVVTKEVDVAIAMAGPSFFIQTPEL